MVHQFIVSCVFQLLQYSFVLSHSLHLNEYSICGGRLTNIFQVWVRVISLVHILHGGGFIIICFIYRLNLR